MGSIKNLGIYREQNNLTHDWRYWIRVVYVKLEQRPPIQYTMQLESKESAWGSTHQPNYLRIPSPSKPLKCPPIIFCYWNWCLLVSLCHGLLRVRGSNRFKTRVGSDVSLIRGFPQPHLIQAIVSPVLVDHFKSKSFMLMQSQSHIILFQFLQAFFLEIKQDL